ncbi:hypothetical protein BDR22DRAFT_440417 [Usnea florida]
MAPEAEESTEHVCKKSRLTRESFSAVVQVKVGHEKTFIVYRDILCRSAPYFKAALEGGFKESQDQVLELPDDDPTAFSHFQLWLYTGNILESHKSAKDIDWRVLISIYLFGDVRGIPGLQNEAIDVLIDKLEAMNKIPVNQIPRIYKNTLDGSPLRKLVVDLFTHEKIPLTDDYWFHEERKPKYPQQFLIDLAKSLYEDRARYKTKDTEFKAVRSNYHIHNDGKKE